MKRVKMNKRSARQTFNHRTSLTKKINRAPPPMRGGYRL